MNTNSMTPNERVWAAIRLEEPDRTPIIPTLLPEPTATLAGLSQAQIASDNETVLRAFFEVFDAFGGWDNPYPTTYIPVQLQLGGVFPMKMKIPGKDLPDDIPFQLDEAEILQPEDYETITAIGYDRFFQEDFLWRVTDLSREEAADSMTALLKTGAGFLSQLAERGISPFFLASGMHPFFSLSLMRSLVSFTQDVFYRPEPVERALRRMTDDYIAKLLSILRASGTKILLCSEERAGGAFFSPKFFERFWWPYTCEIVEAMWAEGIVTLFHLDTCWDKNLPYFKQLPKGSAILELDSTTDIIAAKGILGDHICLKGDVPASLLSIGKPEDVRAYCQKLIREVGKGGGFILSSGCSVPASVKPENFRAMLQANSA